MSIMPEPHNSSRKILDDLINITKKRTGTLSEGAEGRSLPAVGRMAIVKGKIIINFRN